MGLNLVLVRREGGGVRWMGRSRGDDRGIGGIRRGMAFVRWSDLKTSRSATVAAVLTSDSQPSRIVLRTMVMPRR